MSDKIKKYAEHEQILIKEFERRFRKFKDLFSENYNDIFNPPLFSFLLNGGFLTCPASTKYHGAYVGGLFDHSLAVTNFLVDLTNRYDIHWVRPESPYIIGMLHDVCKMDDYVIVSKDKTLKVGDVSIPVNPKWEFNKDSLLNGHGDKSVIAISNLVSLTEEEMLCIRYHMGAFKTEDWNAYGKAIEKYETVLWTHTADMYASRVLGL